MSYAKSTTANRYFLTADTAAVGAATMQKSGPIDAENQAFLEGPLASLSYGDDDGCQNLFRRVTRE